MPLSSANYNTRRYDGPAVTSNATALTVTGDFHVTKEISTSGNVSAYDIHASNTFSTDHLTVTGDISAPNITCSNASSTNLSFANMTTHGADFDISFDVGDNQGYITNTIKRALFGSIWLGGGSSAEVVHNLNVDPIRYCVIANLCETGNTQQMVTLQVSNKAANSFWINCVPENTSNTAMINFSVRELVIHTGIHDVDYELGWDG